MSDKRVKVTDRRMFTLDGTLRDEYRHLEAEGSEAVAPDPGSGLPEPTGAKPPGPELARPQPPGPEPVTADPAASRVPGYPERVGAGPRFMDLIGLLAEPASIYLRDASAGDLGTVAGSAKADQSLELARLHIDLMAVLQEKTAGNLNAQERAMLDDVLYRLRSGYVQAQD